MHFWKPLATGLGRIVGRFLPRARRVEAVLSDGTRLRSLLVGGDLFPKYLLSFPCYSAARPGGRSRMRIDAVRKLGERPPARLDLCLATLPLKGLQPPDGSWRFRQQEFVRQRLDISPSAAPNRRLTSKLKETQRRIRRHGFSSLVSRDAGDFAFFYQRMFLPHTRNQFGSHADIESQRDMEGFFRRGFVVFVVRDGVRVAGSLCLVENGVLVYRRMGVLDGERAYLNMGVQAAGYCFFIAIARDLGCHTVDFMKSRPFLDDGVYRHKRDWGASVHPDDESDTWVYHLHLGDSRSLVRFYAENPVIVCAPEGLEAVVGIPTDQPVDAAVLRDRFHSPGLSGLLALREPPHAPVRIRLADEGGG